MKVTLTDAKQVVSALDHNEYTKVTTALGSVTRKVSHDVYKLVKRFKKVVISTEMIPGAKKWKWVNSGNYWQSGIDLLSPKGKDYWFCKKGIWKTGLKLPKQNFVYVKLGK